MKKNNLFAFTALAIFSLLLSACGGATASTKSVGAKVSASPIEFTGIVEAIEGDQVTVDGQVITVSPEILASGGFSVGDTVEVEATADENGVLVADAIALEDSSDDSNANDNSNDNDDDDSNANDNSNDDDDDDDDSNANDNSNDDDDDDDDSSDDDDDDDSSDDDDDDDDDDDSNSNNG